MVNPQEVDLANRHILVVAIGEYNPMVKVGAKPGVYGCSPVGLASNNAIAPPVIASSSQAGRCSGSGSFGSSGDSRGVRRCMKGVGQNGSG